jgi:hypothetical protein
MSLGVSLQADAYRTSDARYRRDGRQVVRSAWARNRRDVLFFATYYHSRI